MTETLDQVRDHYGAAGVMERLKAALSPFGSGPLNLESLAALDQFHTRGLAATVDLAALAAVEADQAVLDVGSGLGGPARFLARTYGCKVTGIDLSPPFVEASGYLTERTGLSGLATFQVGSALDMPFEAGDFDLAMLQHVAMNIADRPGLYREIRRVLTPRGRLAIFDIVLRTGHPDYPTPWATSASESFLLTAEDTRLQIERAGFRARIERDDTEAAKAWIQALWAGGPPPSPNLSVVMGPNFPQLAANLGRALIDGRVGVLTAVFEAA